jgi:glycosyltransferase involved in cell wall biosynthesis
MKYLLITPARNEEKFIQKTLDSVCAQSVLPERWVIVDDGSTDGTAAIVEHYAERCSFIQLLRRPPRAERTFGGKALAFNYGYDTVKDLDFDIVGNLDADISFDSQYMAFLLQQFEKDPKLGVGGTAMKEADYDSLTDSYYSEEDVFGACQLFRRNCFEQVGGYTPIKWGGLDWIAVRNARFNGWRTRSFREHPFFHHRPMGATESTWCRARFEYGMKDYYLGNHPVWEGLRLIFQLTKKPYVIGSAFLLAGYAYSWAAGVKRPISYELMQFHRREQIGRLKQLLQRRIKALRFG